MNAIPAKVAGVGELIMVTPPTENMSNEVLAGGEDRRCRYRYCHRGHAGDCRADLRRPGFIPQVDKIVGPATPLLQQPKSWRSVRSILT